MSAIRFWFEFLCCMLMAAGFLTAIVCGFLFFLCAAGGNVCLNLLWTAGGGLATFLFLLWLGEALKFPGTKYPRD